MSTHSESTVNCDGSEAAIEQISIHSASESEAACIGNNDSKNAQEVDKCPASMIQDEQEVTNLSPSHHHVVSPLASPSVSPRGSRVAFSDETLTEASFGSPSHQRNSSTTRSPTTTPNRRRRPRPPGLRRSLHFGTFSPASPFPASASSSRFSNSPLSRLSSPRLSMHNRNRSRLSLHIGDYPPTPEERLSRHFSQHSLAHPPPDRHSMPLSLHLEAQHPPHEHVAKFSCFKSLFLPLVSLVSFSIFTFSNAANWLTYSPISAQTIETFNMSSFQLNLLSMIYMFLFPIGAPIANGIATLASATTGLLIGAFLNFVGSFLRYGAYFTIENGGVRAYVMLLSGQVLCSCAQCFLIGVPPLIAHQYFPPKLRPLVTAIATLMNSLGTGATFLVSPLFNVIGMGWWQLIWAVISAVAFVGIAIFFFLTEVVMCIQRARARKILRRNPLPVSQLVPGPASSEPTVVETFANTQHNTVIDGNDGEEHDGQVYSRGPEDNIEINSYQDEEDDTQMGDFKGTRVISVPDVHPYIVSSASFADLTSEFESSHGGIVSVEGITRTVDESASHVHHHCAENPVKKNLTFSRKLRKLAWTFFDNILEIVRPFFNIHFLLLTFCFGVAMGAIWTISTMLDQILKPLGYEAGDTAIMGVVNVLSGVAGIFAAGVLASFTRHLRSLLKIFFALSGLSMIIFGIFSRPGVRGWLIMCQAIIGFTTSAVNPLSQELIAECIFPINEAIGAKYLSVSGNAIAIALILTMDRLVVNGHVVASVWILVGICVAASTLSCCFVGKYKRRKFEKEQKMEMRRYDDAIREISEKAEMSEIGVNGKDGDADSELCDDPMVRKNTIVAFLEREGHILQREGSISVMSVATERAG
uniref:Major facilitator superfamily (MFS) profile domain-containing protein n=1 Tax=Percolomonas cosmopolitus TaxID=63605 RepID=A0A7S1KU66_9EUKA|mmetsp:Transcript_9239/g.34178  ORF Transcript_9239/g.34178 Transcript_9239/m.34178 type:complete len:870 (+) Transcript_9239:332-2941(+)